MKGSFAGNAFKVGLGAWMALSAHAADIVLVPVGATGPHEIVGNEIILSSGGQAVTFEIRVSGWDPYELRLWQIGLDQSMFASGNASPILPLGWDRPVVPKVGECLDTPCPHEWPVCDDLLAICVGPNYHPEDGFFLDASRSDYVFFGLPELPAVNYLEYGAGSTVMDPDAYPTYEPPSKYIMTVILVVSEDAGGTFTIQLDSEDTALYDPVFVIIPLTLLDAFITIAESDCGNGACELGEDYESCPADCSREPRVRPVRSDDR